jgi:hypothetical protein
VYTYNPNLLAAPAKRKCLRASLLLATGLTMLWGVGCSRFRHVHHETVYVSARQTYLHDRVAAVSNRVALVTNGQQLDVLEHGHRFLKVQTAKNEIGWIEERGVIDAKTFSAFEQLGTQHAKDPVVAVGSVRDDIYLHLIPGRDAERFYLLAGNSKVQLLARTSVAKGAVLGPETKQLPAKTAAPAATVAAPKFPKAARPAAPALPEAEPPPLEDWWLVRDGQGRTGWLLAGRVDVDVPEEIGEYAEGQRIVGAYVLAKVTDPQATTPNHVVPEYVTVLGPPKSGLPFDFDQVRVFTWSLKHHRYETAFRLHPIAGYLPLKAGTQPVGGAPVFSFLIANGPDMTTDPATGISHPAAMRTINYEMDDTRVKRIGPDMGPIPIMRSAESKDKAKPGKPAKKKRK